MTSIIITKSYKLENGDVNGMFKVPAERVTKELRIALVEFEGVEAEIKAAPKEAPALIPNEPDTSEAAPLSKRFIDAVLAIETARANLLSLLPEIKSVEERERAYSATKAAAEVPQLPLREIYGIPLEVCPRSAFEAPDDMG